MEDKIYPISNCRKKSYSYFWVLPSGGLSCTGHTFNSLKSSASNAGYKDWVILRIQPSIKYLYKWNEDHWLRLTKQEKLWLKKGLGLLGKPIRQGDSSTVKTKKVERFSRRLKNGKP